MSWLSRLLEKLKVLPWKPQLDFVLCRTVCFLFIYRSSDKVQSKNAALLLSIKTSLLVHRLYFVVLRNYCCRCRHIARRMKHQLKHGFPFFGAGLFLHSITPVWCRSTGGGRFPTLFCHFIWSWYSYCTAQESLPQDRLKKKQQKTQEPRQQTNPEGD